MWNSKETFGKRFITELTPKDRKIWLAFVKKERFGTVQFVSGSRVWSEAVANSMVISNAPCHIANTLRRSPRPLKES